MTIKINYHIINKLYKLISNALAILRISGFLANFETK